MKDLFDFKPGWPVTFGGVRALKDLVIDAYCTYAERVEKAGAILIGKTNSPILGFRGVTDNYLFGPTANPFDTAYNPGGSSGGSAAAVADGLVPFAEGSDGGGSIRIPAAWTGVYGYKASFGRVPMVMRPDAWAGSDPYIYEGPLTRTVEDAALVMNALAGYDARDPYSLDEDVDFLPATRRSIKGMRIAYSPDLDVFPVDPRIAKVVGEAVEAFKEAGAHVEEVKLGLKRDQRELSDLWCRLIIPLSIVAFERMRKSGFDLLGDHRDDFPPEFLYWVDKYKDKTVLEHIADQEMRTEVYDALQGVFADHDVLVCPTLRRCRSRTAPTATRSARPRSTASRSTAASAGARRTSATTRAIPRPRSRRASRTACRWACRSWDAATPTPTCWRRAPRSSGCGRGTTPTRAARSARSPKPSPRGRAGGGPRVRPAARRGGARSA